MSDKSIFSKIIDREAPANIIFENERIIVIEDIKKDAPIHYLGITKHPFKSMHELLMSDSKDLLWELMNKLAEIAANEGIAETGYRFVTNIGPNAHQVVPHLHVHLLGGACLHMKDPNINA
ncbi:MAG TPA: HIT domain-containing protein [Verrucomicrobiae bacterium]|nr:HIT domain-containing protein [Verrucomicrobiae bacterium]